MATKNMTAAVVVDSNASLLAELAALKAENESLKAARGEIKLKVGDKGGICVCGLGRFPTTLYKEQWERLLDGCTGGIADKMREFIAAHGAELSTKEKKAAAEKAAALVGSV
jgi:hypothetical protein